MKTYYITVTVLTVLACVWMSRQPKTPPPEEMVQRTVTEVITPCCLCELKHENGSELRSYGGPRLCERLSHQEFLGECKRIDILGEQCSFYQISYSGGKSKCKSKPIAYFEHGMKKFLHPPQNVLSPCDAKTTLAGLANTSSLLVNKQGDPAKDGRESGNPTHVDPNKPREYWTCEVVPTSPGNCVAKYIEDGQTVKTKMKPLPGGADTCSAEVCRDLFDEDFTPQASNQ